MKRFGLLLLILIPTSIVAAYLGFRVGSVVGRHRVTTARAVSVTCNLDALKKIQSGDVSGARHILERTCFIDAAEVLSDTAWNPESLHKVLIPLLRDYRKSYRTNQADWTPEERQLEILLAGRR